MTKCVLIAEKHPSWRSSYREELERAFPDITIDELTSNLGDDLVEKVLNNEYKVVITNNRMTDYEGIEAITRIRNAGNNVPIYLITADSHRKETVMNGGATGYYNKSNFMIRDLVTELHQYLK